MPGNRVLHPAAEGHPGYSPEIIYNQPLPMVSGFHAFQARCRGTVMKCLRLPINNKVTQCEIYRRPRFETVYTCAGRSLTFSPHRKEGGATAPSPDGVMGKATTLWKGKADSTFLTDPPAL